MRKPKKQGQTELWSKQRVGRLTGSNFYRVCHIRENTNNDYILKDLLNYQLLPPEKQPEQFRWGHEKEISALDLYVKKLQKSTRDWLFAKVTLLLMCPGHTLVQAQMAFVVASAVQRG